MFAQVGPFAPPLLPGVPLPTSRPAYPPIDLNKPTHLEKTMHAMDRFIEEIEKQVDTNTIGPATLDAVTALQVYTAVAKTTYPDNVGELLGDANGIGAGVGDSDQRPRRGQTSAVATQR
jgi:hypothetical protein